MSPISKIAKLLRTPEEVILDITGKMERVTGKKGVVEKIVEENEQKVEEKLRELGLNQPKAEEVYGALIEKVKYNDRALFELFKRPRFDTTEGCRTLIHAASELAGSLKGFFLKLEKARELIRLHKPYNVIEALDYPDVEELLGKEDIREIFCALRFAEDEHWLNDAFLRSYEDLTKSDFEEREMQVRILGGRWKEMGERFMGEKLHNLSHLKELGIVFAIPRTKAYYGQTFEFFIMVLHYLYEIDFYSQLFRKYSEEKDFGPKMISAIKGEIKGRPLPDEKGVTWGIVPRYVAKRDPDDPRLFEPHVNPEAFHYVKAEDDLKDFARRFPQLELEFWNDLDFVGKYFLTREGKEVLVSFDVVDNIYSLVNQSDIQTKYLYHQQEALWTKLFAEYVGEEEMERLVGENLDRGYISLGS